MPWDPDLYHRFREQRSAPFFDLLRLIQVRPGLQVIDLGCGTGELTRTLADHLPESTVLGVDTSPEMLERAALQANARVRFERQDIAQATGQWDLVFSNAAIQWVDDHVSLIPRLLSMVAPGGQLVVQLPSNHEHVTHTLVLDLAAQEPFRTALGGWNRPFPVLGIDSYAQLLHDHGATDLTVLEKVYPHVLPDADALVEWTSGTTLVPYLERLPEGLRDRFIATYRAELHQSFPTSPVFYGFRRILFAASRP
ncbi:MAG: methyltransferase domain-containing protein [Chloroflexi bacterium]|nr:methyltransferase domain-containing protein [Chloroflexota bacterium]